MKPWAIGDLIIGDEWQTGTGTWYSLLRDSLGLPQVTIIPGPRYGAWPIIAGLNRPGRSITLETRFLADDATRDLDRIQLFGALNPEDEDTVKLIAVDNILPGIGDNNLLAAFGPWDLRYDGTTWTVRDLFDQIDATLAGAWALAPGEGLDLDAGTDECSLTGTDVAGTNAIEVIWKPTENYAHAADRYLYDDGTVSLHFDAIDDKWELTDGVTTIQSTAQTFSAAALQHIIARFGVAGAGELKLTVNGTETTGLGNAVALGATINMGSEATPSLWARGELVCFRFYDDLTTAQAGYLYAAFAAATDDPIGNARWLNVIAQDVAPLVDSGKRTMHLVSTLAIDSDPRWRSRDGDYQHWDVTASPDTQSVVVATDDKAFPILYIKPIAAKTSGFLYKRWLTITWKAGAATNYPTKLGTLDTSALIKTATATTLDGDVLAAETTISLTDASSFPTQGMAYITDAVPGDEQISWTGKSGNDLTGCTRGIGGTADLAHSDLDPIAVSKMLANCDDLRVYNGDTEIDRWIQDPDTATTDIWVVLDYEVEQSALLGTAIGAGDTITTITASESISDFPSEGILWIDVEAFTYNGKNDANKQFLNVTRAARGTAAAAHTTADTIYWIQHDLWVYYGDHSLAAPTTDDDYKPIMELDSSGNGSWVYQEFGEDAVSRAGGWTQYFESGAAPSLFYTATQGGNATPWEEIGIYLGSAGHILHFYLYNPCGITNANFTNGEQRYNTAVGAVICHFIKSSTNGTTWTTEYSIPLPAAADNWEVWSRNEALTAGSTYVALTATAGAPDVHYVEAADVTLTLDATYSPARTTGDEQAHFALDCVIENTTTGDSIELSVNLDIDDVLEIDTDNKTVKNLTEGSSIYGALTLTGGVRRDWLPLINGTNSLSYTEAGVTDVDIEILWDRRYYE